MLAPRGTVQGGRLSLKTNPPRSLPSHILSCNFQKQRSVLFEDMWGEGERRFAKLSRLGLLFKHLRATPHFSTHTPLH